MSPVGSFLAFPHVMIGLGFSEASRAVTNFVRAYLAYPSNASLHSVILPPIAKNQSCRTEVPLPTMFHSRNDALLTLGFASLLSAQIAHFAAFYPRAQIDCVVERSELFVGWKPTRQFLGHGQLVLSLKAAQHIIHTHESFSRRLAIDWSPWHLSDAEGSFFTHDIE